MGMDHEYDVRASVPGETLSVHIASHREGRLAFDATLNLRRRPFSRRRLAGASLRTLALIYAHAIALKLKGVPVPPASSTGGLVIDSTVSLAASLALCWSASSPAS